MSRPVKYVDMVPTSWLDPLLTGPEAIIKAMPGGQYTGTDIENLLRAVRQRISAMENETARPEALCTDAERYRWLRDKDIVGTPFPRKGVFVGCIERPDGHDSVLTGEDADKAIDAERSVPSPLAEKRGG